MVILTSNPNCKLRISRCYRLNAFSAVMIRMNEKEAGLLRPASFAIHVDPLFQTAGFSCSQPAAEGLGPRASFSGSSMSTA
jgi:hypothetical protein